MGYTTITRNHPDYLKLRVLMTLFGGYFGSRLMSNIREEKGYTYGISAGIMFYPDSGLLAISTEDVYKRQDYILSGFRHSRRYGRGITSILIKQHMFIG